MADGPVGDFTPVFATGHRSTIIITFVDGQLTADTAKTPEEFVEFDVMSMARYCSRFKPNPVGQDSAVRLQ
jgi:hypothetical protein